MWRTEISRASAWAQRSSLPRVAAVRPSSKGTSSGCWLRQTKKRKDTPRREPERIASIDQQRRQLTHGRVYRNMKKTAPTRQRPAHKKLKLSDCFMYRTAK